MHAYFALVAVALPLAFAAPLQGADLFRRQDNASATEPTCDLSGLQQPANTLTPPTTGLELEIIARGKGTQNYTCADAAAKPVAIGAVASLFNASCTVANGGLGDVQEDAVGKHFFADNTTPEFDIIGIANTQFKKTENMTAPTGAQDVPWLKLDAVGSSSPVKLVYRLNTEGGVAPATCSGQAANSVVTVPYEAEYWVYVDPAQLAARKMKRSLAERQV
jgi:hypothetical protein